MDTDFSTNEDIGNKIFIHNNNNGDFSITYPITDCGLTYNEIVENMPISNNEYTIIEEKDLPIDKSFIGAWTYDHANKKIDIDIEKAKEIQKDNIRSVRDALLKKEDINFFKAVESGDTLEQNASANRKQILRDLPEIVDNVEITESNIDEISSQIESAWDENLLGSNTFIFKEERETEILSVYTDINNQ